MKKGPTLFARGVLYLVAAAGLAVCFLLLPELAREEAAGKQSNPLVTNLFLATAYIIAVPFFIALYQTLKLLNLIDAKKAFSHHSLKALQIIKMCTIAFSALIVIAVIAGVSFAKSIDPTEDVTFMITFGFILTFVASVMTVFVAVLQKLLADAVAMKSENDLIV